MNLRTFLNLRCPVCERGKIFHRYLDTPERCAECGFYFMRETGYFLPHGPISYLLVLISAVVIWFVLRYVMGVRSDGIVLFAIVVLPVLFGVWSNRYAKMLWLSFDLWMHPPSRDDFEPRGR